MRQNVTKNNQKRQIFSNFKSTQLEISPFIFRTTRLKNAQDYAKKITEPICNHFQANRGSNFNWRPAVNRQPGFRRKNSQSISIKSSYHNHIIHRRTYTNDHIISSIISYHDHIIYINHITIISYHHLHHIISQSYTIHHHHITIISYHQSYHNHIIHHHIIHRLLVNNHTQKHQRSLNTIHHHNIMRKISPEA